MWKKRDWTLAILKAQPLERAMHRVGAEYAAAFYFQEM